MMCRMALILLFPLVIAACGDSSPDVVEDVPPVQPEATSLRQPSTQPMAVFATETLETVKSTLPAIDAESNTTRDVPEESIIGQQSSTVESSGAPVPVDKFQELRRFGTGSFSVLAISPDGSTVAIGGSLGILLYDTGTFQLKRIIPTSKPDIVAWSPDSRYLAAGARDRGVASVWDAVSGELQTERYQLSSDQVTGIAWRSGGSALASASVAPSSEDWITVWDSKSTVGTMGNIGLGCCFGDVASSQDKEGRFLAATRGAEGRVEVVDLANEDITAVQVTDYVVAHKVAWSPSNLDLAILGNDGDGVSVVVLWDVASGQKRAVLRGSEFPGDVAWSPDGQRLAIAEGNWREPLPTFQTKIIRTSDGEVGYEISGCCRNIAWSTNGDKVIGITSDGQLGREAIQVFDAVTGRFLNEVVSFELTDVAWASAATQVVTTDRNGARALWDVDTGQLIDVVNGSSGGTSSPDGTKLASVVGNEIRIEDAATGKEILVLRDRAEAIVSLTWAPDGKLIASGDYSFGRVRIWDTRNGELLYTVEDPEDPDRNRNGLTTIWALEWSSSGRWLAVTTPTAVQVWNTTTWQLARSFVVEDGMNPRTGWSPSKRWFVVVRPAAFEIAVWDTVTWELAHSFSVQDSFEYGDLNISWSPNERRLAIVQSEELEIWDTQNWQPIRSSSAQDMGPGFSWSPDGMKLASIDGDIVTIWDMANGQNVKKSSIPQNDLTVRFWSPDSRFLLATHKYDRFTKHLPPEEGTIYVLAAVDGQVVGSLVGHSVGIRSHKWSPNGEYLATVGSDGSVRIWGVPSDGNSVVIEEAIITIPTRTSTPAPTESTPAPATPTPRSTDTPVPTVASPTSTPKPTAIDTPSAIMATPAVVSPGPSIPAGTIRVAEEDGVQMVFVPAGEFVMGSSESFAGADEQPQHFVYLNAFWIDRTEVSSAMYRLFINETGYRDISYNISPDHPVVSINWEDAAAYCEWAGRRLPSEAEWEKAARGTDGRIYPWGNEITGAELAYCDPNCRVSEVGERLNDGLGMLGIAPVGSYPLGASPYGALDMAGNVIEWVADWYDSGFYTRSPSSNPVGPESASSKVARGGLWHPETWTLFRTSMRIPENLVLFGPDSEHYYPQLGGIGFRCAATAASP